jgi:hypothetical protein
VTNPSVIENSVCRGEARHSQSAVYGWCCAERITAAVAKKPKKAAETLPVGVAAALPEPLTAPSLSTKEQHMIRLVLFVTGIVAGAIGTLVVEHPKQAATKVRRAAESVMKKVRERYDAGEPPNDKPAEGPDEKAA